MASVEQSGEPLRDFSSPATWGDVEQVRTSLETKTDSGIAEVKVQISEVQAQVAEVRTEMARLETRLERRIGGLEGQLETQGSQLNSRIDGLEGQLESQGIQLNGRIDGLEGRVDTAIAGLETRLLRWSAGLAVAAGVSVIGFLVGILQTVD